MLTVILSFLPLLCLQKVEEKYSNDAAPQRSDQPRTAQLHWLGGLEGGGPLQPRTETAALRGRYEADLIELSN